MKKIKKPHDYFFRSVLSNIAIAKDFFLQHVPEDVLERCNLETLKLEKNSYIDADLKELISDVLFSVDFDGEPGYFYLLLEHVRSENVLQAWWMVQYQVKIVADHLKKHKTRRLPMVYPLVFFNGKRPFKAPTCVYDLYGDNHKLAEKLMFNGFQLIDVNTLSDEQLIALEEARLMQFIMKHIDDADFGLHLQKVSNIIKYVQEKGGIEFVETMITYVLVASQSNKDEIIDSLKNSLTGEMEETMPTVAEQLIQEGVQQGMQQGVQQGKQLQSVQIAKSLLESGIDIDVIESSTGLSRAELLKLGEQESVSA